MTRMPKLTLWNETLIADAHQNTSSNGIEFLELLPSLAPLLASVALDTTCAESHQLFFLWSRLI